MNEQQLQQAYTRHCETTGQTKTTRTGFEDFKAGFRLGQPAAGEPVAKYRERSNHHVIRQDESLPCYCWAESDHRIGQEVAAPPAAAHVADGEQAEPGEVGRAEFEAECRKQHRDITRNDVRGFEWGYLNHLTHDRWCGFNMAVRCMGLDRAPPAAAHGDEAVRKDAERYRWLRNPGQDVALVLDKKTGHVPVDERGFGGYGLYEYRAGTELDEAIDAAMRAQGDRSADHA